MKKILTITCLFIFAFTFNHSLQAQEELKWSGVDASVMDMAYFPSRIALRHFAKTDAEKTAKPSIRAIYSRPLKKDREIFGNLVKYGDVWRAGANESTEVTFYQDVKVGDTKLKKGRYTVHVVPSKDKWEVHFTDYLDRWGSYGLDPAKNTKAKITVPTEKTDDPIEAFTIMFLGVDDGAHMLMGWDDTMFRVLINF